ncbi:MAG: 30S ribosomal protein S12 methylthiotransferase RimO [Dehalococcoidia bacterium]
MPRKAFHIVSLGCAKNTVDSESMAQLLVRAGHKRVGQPGRAGIIIVNTCGFIGPAKEESINTLCGLASKKRDGQLLIAAGCLTQRYGEEVAKQVPGVDGILGTRRWMDIVQVVDRLRERGSIEPVCHLPATATIGRDERDTVRASASGGSAYLKIADGCRRPCSFCAIPLIKGPPVSRPIDAILNDARILRDRGVRELVLIAQDTTDYGHDLGMKDGLTVLLEKLIDAVPDIDWIRIMYAYPGRISDRLIDIMAGRKQILPYIDLPLQHADPRTLRRMKRPSNIDNVRKTLARMREAMPGLAVRTTFLVGYPGETEEEFRTLLDFVREMRFDRLGAFKFSFEPGTPAESLGDPIPEEVKTERLDRLMSLQQDMSLQVNRTFVGRTLDVLVEGCDNGITVGRSYRDAPEVDGLVITEGEADTGQMVRVKITDAMPYDLRGKFTRN